MSKRGYFSRYTLILKKLKARPYCSYKELEGFIVNEVEHLRLLDDTLEIGFSKRTLQRDIQEIRNNFGIDITYSRSSKGYYINQTEHENKSFQRLMEAFDVFNSLNLSQDITPFIHLEKRGPQGTENLHGLIHAIKNKLMINFNYHSFWEETDSVRSAAPIGLKEFKNRWYLLAEDHKDTRVKSFALDRLKALTITNKRINTLKTFHVEEHYRNCFGIISPNSETIQHIILSFNPHQGKFIKTLPLHETQRILFDTEHELQVELHLYITHDLVMELLSFGKNVTVIQPEKLRKEIKQAHYDASQNY